MYIYFFVGGRREKKFNQTQNRFFIKHMQILAKGPGIAMCSIISQLDCKSPCFYPSFSYFPAAFRLRLRFLPCVPIALSAASFSQLFCLLYQES